MNWGTLPGTQKNPLIGAGGTAVKRDRQANPASYRLKTTRDKANPLHGASNMTSYP